MFLILAILAINKLTNINNANNLSGMMQPTESITKLIRDVLILCPFMKRNILQWILSFIRKLSEGSNSLGVEAAVKMFSNVFGPVLLYGVKKVSMYSTEKNMEWSGILIELLIHANGITELEEKNSILWNVKII